MKSQEAALHSDDAWAENASGRWGLFSVRVPRIAWELHGAAARLE